MEKLYDQLMALTNNENKTFFFSDFEFLGKNYRIFNYRLSSWGDFLLPGALNCRGTMFDITNINKPILVSLPPEKFFNYEEGNVDHLTNKKLGDIMVKMDGSLISTFLHDKDLFLKSKGSLYSSQAVDSNKLLKKEENKHFYNELLDLCHKGFTINLEYTAPHNRIVVPYQEERLSVLSARSHIDGKNFFASKLIKEILKDYPEIKKNLVAFNNNINLPIDEFVTKSREEQQGEGYVVEVIDIESNSSYLFKAKNTKYLALHHTKDSVNNSRRLFEAIIEESSDDLKSMFTDDPYTLEKIIKMEEYVMPIFNTIISTVDDFYEKNKTLDRKSYAILAKQTEPMYMGLLMNKFLKQENDYKHFAKKYRRELFKIEEEVNEPNEEEVAYKIRPKM